MLVLSRKVDEEIYIGDIVIKLVDTAKGVAKIGIEAPKDMQILRGELKKAIEDTNKEASQSVTKKEVKDLSRLLKK